MTSLGIPEPRSGQGRGLMSSALALDIPNDRTMLPSEYDAETALLSSVLQKGELATGLPNLTPSSFGDRRHAEIFRSLRSLNGSGYVDCVLLADNLTKRGQLDAAGGKDYIGWLLDVTPSPNNATHYAKLVERGAARRHLLSIAQKAVDSLCDPKGDTSEIAERIRADLLAPLAAADRRPKFLSYEELEALPDVPHLVEAMLFCASVIGLIGPPGSFKSFVALDIAFCIALGLEYHGLRVRCGPVVYICSEGAAGFKKRAKAIKKFYGVTGNIPIHFLPARLALEGNSADLAWLVAEIQRIKPVLIVVDTLARNYVGAENDTEDMNGFVAACDSMKEATGAAILVVHHTGHENKERGRGNSALPAALDTQIVCVRDADRLTLKCTKQKDDDEFSDMYFETIRYAESLVLKRVDQHTGKLDGQRLDCLKSLNTNFGQAGGTFGDWHKATGLPKSSFSNARNWLEANTYIRKRDGKHYTLTEAGIESLRSVSPRSNGGPSLVQTSRSGLVQSGGGLKTHPLDQRRPDTGEAA